MAINLNWKYRSVKSFNRKTRRYTITVYDTGSGVPVWVSPPKRTRELAAAELVGWILGRNHKTG